MKTTLLFCFVSLAVCWYIISRDPKSGAAVLIGAPQVNEYVDSAAVVAAGVADRVVLGFKRTVPSHVSEPGNRILRGFNVFVRELRGTQEDLEAPKDELRTKTYQGAIDVGIAAWRANDVAQKLIAARSYTNREVRFLEYIKKYREVAIKQYLDYGIPVSITLAQALLESNGGAGDVATQANNHFCIKCGSGWQGDSYAHYDDEETADHRKIKSLFRVYTSVEDSYRAHSLLLKGKTYAWIADFSEFEKMYPAHPGWFGKSQVNSYEAWCIGLKWSGYATAKSYHRSVRDLIVKFELYRYDVAVYNYIYA